MCRYLCANEKNAVSFFFYLACACPVSREMDPLPDCQVGSRGAACRPVTWGPAPRSRGVQGARRFELARRAWPGGLVAAARQLRRGGFEFLGREAEKLPLSSRLFLPVRRLVPWIHTVRVCVLARVACAASRLRYTDHLRCKKNGELENGVRFGGTSGTWLDNKLARLDPESSSLF
jgi:hypothetical protein